LEAYDLDNTSDPGGLYTTMNVYFHKLPLENFCGETKRLSDNVKRFDF